MLAEVENRYDSREDFAFVAWSPHWMNQRYDFKYLEDPKDAFGELNDPARILTIVNEGLPEDDRVAYAFMEALKLDEDQLNDLESTINEAGDPLEGGGGQTRRLAALGRGRRERARVLRKDPHTTLNCAGMGNVACQRGT